MATEVHGVRKFLATGRITGESNYLTRVLREFHRAIEGVIVKRHGELSVYDAAVMQSATRHEGVALLWQRHLRKEAKNITTEQRLAICREVRSATDARDKCLRELGLNRRESPMDDIYKTIDIQTAGQERTPDDA